MESEARDSVFRSGLHFLLVGVIAAGVDVFVVHQFPKAQLAALTMLFIVLQLLGIYLVFLISRRLDEIAPRVGIRATVMPYPKAYQELTEAVRRANEEILIVSNWTLRYQVNMAAEADRQLYFDLLLEKAKAGVTYERVAQMTKPAEQLADVFPVLEPHLRECIEARDSKLGKVGVSRCPPTSLVSFTLIDSKFLLLQLDEFDSESQHYQVSQAIVIEDETKKITRVFKEMFEELKRKSEALWLKDLVQLQDSLSIARKNAPNAAIP